MYFFIQNPNSKNENLEHSFGENDDIYNTIIKISFFPSRIHWGKNVVKENLQKFKLFISRIFT